MSRPTLAQQLKQLEADERPSVDPETAYSNLESLDIAQRQGNEGREHYLDVGPSRLRGQFGDMGERYGGQVTGRQKIFDDDDDEDEDEDEDGQADEDDEEEDEDDDEEDEEEGDEDEENDDDDEGEEDEDEDEEDEEDEDEDVEDGDSQEEEPIPDNRPKQTSTSAKLDPIASLRDSRQKDVEKGKAIKRQKAIFDSVVALRITFQKALSASSTIPSELPQDAAGEVSSKREAVLRSLGDLNERLFALREGLRLPATETVGAKRKREEDEVPSERYWLDCANDSFALTDATHPNVLPIVEKWSSKIQAASLQVGAKGSKFLQSTQNGAQSGIMEVIQAGLSTRKENAKPLIESEETAYRSLLREVIESRSGQAPSDLSHLRREKKKKREAERGGSKGRKLRYTVHEKAQNFVVPIPLSQGWHEEQVDELFGSLFGGAGMRGAKSEGGAINGGGLVDGEEGIAELGGLRVF